MSRRFLALIASLAAALSGCSAFHPDRFVAYAKDDLSLFAYDLGRTHAGLANCKQASALALDAHLESARLALAAHAGSRSAELSAVFQQGLKESAGYGHRLHIDCDCAKALVEQSRKHNLGLYRSAAAPRAFDTAGAVR